MIQVEIPDKKHLNLRRTKQLLVQTIVGRSREDWEWSEVRMYFLTHSAVYGVSIYTGHAILEILLFYNLYLLLPAQTVSYMSFYNVYNYFSFWFI